MDIAVASDHIGLEFKNAVVLRLREDGHVILDLGTISPDPVEYPDYAYAAAVAVAKRRVERSIVISGFCSGAAIAANKVAGIRCIAATGPVAVEEARRHHDANVLSLCARFSGWEMIERLCVTFLLAPFEGGVHVERSVKASFFTTMQQRKSEKDVERGYVTSAESTLGP